MNNIQGIGNEILSRFTDSGVSFDHTTTSLDAMSVICHEDELKGKEQLLLHTIERAVQPDRITLKRDIAMVCVVGEGIPEYNVAVHAKLYSALESEDISTFGESYTGGNNIVIAVKSGDLQRTINSLYNSLVQ
jgi:aspartate kinase